jgi:hypothetical protein
MHGQKNIKTRAYFDGCGTSGVFDSVTVFYGCETLLDETVRLLDNRFVFLIYLKCLYSAF